MTLRDICEVKLPPNEPTCSKCGHGELQQWETCPIANCINCGWEHQTTHVAVDQERKRRQAIWKDLAE